MISFLIMFAVTCFLVFSLIISESMPLVQCTNAKDVINKRDDNSKAEVRAVFLDCVPEEWKGSEDLRDNEAVRFQREELFKHNVLQNCNKKLAITVKITSDSEPNVEDEYIPIDHVLEGRGAEGGRVRLLHPYVLRLRREPALQAYRLRRLETVSGVLLESDKAFEEKFKGKRSRIQRDIEEDKEMDEWFRGLQGSFFTLNHGTQGLRSYSVRLKNPGHPFIYTTRKDFRPYKDCGLRLFMANSTEDWTRRVRSLSTQSYSFKEDATQKNSEKLKNMNLPAETSGCKNKTVNIRRKRFVENIRPDEQSWTVKKFDYQKPDRDIASGHPADLISTAKAYTSEPSTDSYPSTRNKKNDFHEAGDDIFNNVYTEELNSIDTSGTVTPSMTTKTRRSEVTNVNRETSPVTKEKEFTIYQISDPKLWYTVHAQLFEKLTTPEGKTVFADITRGEMANVGSIHSGSAEWRNEDLSIRYHPGEWLYKADFILSPASLCLIMPGENENYNTNDDENTSQNVDQELIILPLADIVDDEKNSVFKKHNGSNYYSTPRSPERHHRRVYVRTSRALLAIPDSGFSVTNQGSDRYLTVPHRRPHIARLDLEVRADDNQLVRVGSSGRISVAVADNSRKTRTVLSVQVANTGLAASRFRVAVRDCGPAQADSVTSEDLSEGPMVIAPMHTKRVHVKLSFEEPVEDMHCTVALVNDKEQAVAIRDVTVKRGDRCYCVWHCECVCLKDDTRLQCREMSLPRQSAAGLSPRLHPRRARSLCMEDSLAVDLLVLVIGVIMMLFFLGLLKALLGIFCHCIGSYGLERIVCLPRKMDHYHEWSLRNRPVKYDSDGHPVHPDTGSRNIRLVNRSIEFMLNSVFFIVLPSILLIDALQKLCCKKKRKSLADDASNFESQKCYSSRDIQERRPSVLKKKKKLGDWMTPEADYLTKHLWQKSQGVLKMKSEMRPLLNDTNCSRQGEVHSSCLDSDQDDTEYVLKQMRKSKESLAMANNERIGYDASEGKRSSPKPKH